MHFKGHQSLQSPNVLSLAFGGDEKLLNMCTCTALKTRRISLVRDVCIHLHLGDEKMSWRKHQSSCSSRENQECSAEEGVEL